MNRWTNAGVSIDGHLPIAYRTSYKRVYPRLKAGDAMDASILMHGEGCMPQAATLRMCLPVPARNVWTEWMSAPHDCDMCPLNAREEPIDGLNLEWDLEWTGVWNPLGDTAKPPQSVIPSSPSACWTQVSEPVLLGAGPVCPCILEPAKWRLVLRELG